jgi:hypothetical protein
MLLGMSSARSSGSSAMPGSAELNEAKRMPDSAGVAARRRLVTDDCSSARV